MRKTKSGKKAGGDIVSAARRSRAAVRGVTTRRRNAAAAAAAERDRVAAETDRLRAAEPNPEQARLREGLDAAGFGDASIEDPAVQREAASTVKTQLDQEQALGALADRLAQGIADRLLMVPAARLEPAREDVRTAAGWAGDGSCFPGGEPSLGEMERKREAARRGAMGRNADVAVGSMTGNARGEPVRAVPMQVATNNLVAAITRLEESAALLQDRLAVVLPNRPEEAHTKGEGRGYAGSSDLVRGVEDAASRVDAVVNRIMGLAREVEV